MKKKSFTFVQYIATIVLYILLVGCSGKTCCQSDCQCCEDKENKCCESKCGENEACCQTQKDGCPMQKAVIDNMMTRVSVRQFTGEKISDEQVETLLRCAMAAPSAMNKQPWEFVVISDEAMIKRLGEVFPNSRCGNGAAVAIIPCGNLQRAIEGMPDFWINDLSAATENLLLAAHAMGLGAVWTGVHPGAERVKQLQELLNMPEHIVPLCIVPVGVPAEQPEVKDKWDASRIHCNTF